MSSYRLRTSEKDLSGFVTQSQDGRGATVVKSKKGFDPILCQGEKDVLLYFGKPDVNNWGILEAIEYSRVAPLWVVPALGTGYKWSGVDVKTDAVVGFGAAGGRNYTSFAADPSAAYAAIEVFADYQAGTGDGIVAAYSGTITGATLPITTSSVKLRVGSTYYTVTVDGALNQITGAAINGAGTFNEATGAFNFTFNGTPGSEAELTTTVNGGANFDLSAGGTDKKVDIVIDGVTYANINLGQNAATTLAAVVAAINAAVGYTAAAVSGNFIVITGQVGSATVGEVTVTDPTDLSSSALTLVFDALAVASFDAQVASTGPSGYIPQLNAEAWFEFTSAEDLSGSISHTFFTSSPYDEDVDPLAMSVESITGSQYRMQLYEVINSVNVLVRTYNYSLLQEKDGFGRSMYYEDVFRNDPYVKIVVNPDYALIADPVVAIIALTGGERGADPITGNYTTAWNTFQKVRTYRAKIFFDLYGNSTSTVKTLVEVYQPWGFGMTVIPAGNDRAAAVSYRQGLGIDFDNMAIYTNWGRVQDPYNGTSYWTSLMGKTAVKYAQTAVAFDGLPPAGIDENGIGGQLTGFQILELEYDYTPHVGGDLDLLDNAQINPRIFDQDYGPMLYGNKTMQVSLSDTSYIHTRRIYNYITDNISRLVLRKQEFKINDDLHRLLAKSQCDSFLTPILSGQYLNDAYVVCDTSNNDSLVLDQRQFIVDIYVKAAVSSEFVLLKLTRLAQGAVVSDFIGQ